MTAGALDAGGGWQLDAPIDPATVVSLVQGIVGEPWPADKAAGERLLDRVGLDVRSQRTSNNPHLVGSEQHYTTNLPGPAPVLCSWVVDGGVFKQIYLQLRFDGEPPSPDTTACFEEILRRFTALYGEPEIPWHGRKGLRRMWNAHGLELETHYGNEARSSLMVGISDGLLASLTQD